MMNVLRLRQRMLLGLLLLPAAMTAGCAKKMWVDRYPEFYSPAIRTIAVLPPANNTDNPRAAKVLEKQLVSALKANGTYHVVDPKKVRELLTKAGIPAGADLPQIASALGARGVAQAMLVPSVEDFGATSRQHIYHDVDYGLPGYGYGYGYDYGYGYGYPYGYGYGYGRRGRYYRRHGPYFAPFPYYPPVPYYSTRETTQNEGYVGATAMLLALPDAREIYRTPATVVSTVASEGSTPELAPGDCQAEAARNVARRIAEQVGLAPREIKIKPNDVLRTARIPDGGKPNYTREFTTADATMYAVVTLPGICQHNSFRVEVTPEGKDAPSLAAHQFSWPEGEDEMRLSFDLRALVKSAGVGKFDLRFMQGANREKVVFKQPFEVKAAKAQP